MKRWKVWGAAAIATAVVAGNAHALVVDKANLVNLIRDADSIVVGTVTTVTDGIDSNNGLPYTEVTLNLEETIRGLPSDTYTFRQIGLQNARPTDDGTMMILPAPQGIPRYAVGEHVLLFMGQPASMTGLQSTVGLEFGKFVLGSGSAVNASNNAGVFQNVSLAGGLATSNDGRILTTSMGAVNPDDLLSLVRRAVQGAWTSNCKMWITDEETPKCGSPVGMMPGSKPGTTTLSTPKRTQTPSPRLGSN
jgi:hypothetical protein